LTNYKATKQAANDDDVMTKSGSSSNYFNSTQFAISKLQRIGDDEWKGERSLPTPN